MARVKFHKVTSLPGTLEANALYFVQSDTFSETYVTDDEGVAFGIGNSDMINDLVAGAMSAINNLIKVADITERDALTLDQNSMVLVADASADATVTAGAALYFYDATLETFAKVAEYESMDATVSWASITGKPTSAVADIDDAVAKRHTHANMATLDDLDSNADGLTFDGENVSAVWNTNNW